MILLTLMIEQMDKTLIEKLKEVIQQHHDLTGERVVSLHTEWQSIIKGDSYLTRVRLDIEK